MSQEPCCCPPPEKDPTEACCPPTEGTNSCCPPKEENSCGGQAPPLPGYRLWPFVETMLATPAGPVPRVKTALDRTDTFGRYQMRWGLGRDRYSIAPGLYAVGAPTNESVVLVTANYKLSFDTLRSELEGVDAWILVLDTKGINVWCAAGKGTFGTEEILRRVAESGLEKVVAHRTLVLPQLGAPGVAAHRVKAGCGFSVVYGPVRAGDLKEFLAAGMKATTRMRRVDFTTVDRLILTPVELTGMFRISSWALAILLLLGGVGPGIFSFGDAGTRGGGAFLIYLAGLLAGAVLTPVLLPWIPGRLFAAKGALVGALSALVPLLFFGEELGRLNGLALLFALPAVASYCAMNFTGSTTFTSPSGVEKEMRRAIPLQAVSLLIAGVAWLGAAF